MPRTVTFHAVIQDPPRPSQSQPNTPDQTIETVSTRGPSRTDALLKWLDEPGHFEAVRIGGRLGGVKVVTKKQAAKDCGQAIAQRTGLRTTAKSVEIMVRC
jgi:hypothetical protein